MKRRCYDLVHAGAMEVTAVRFFCFHLNRSGFDGRPSFRPDRTFLLLLATNSRLIRIVNWNHSRPNWA
jgi:hypothetical protein